MLNLKNELGRYKSCLAMPNVIVDEDGWVYSSVAHCFETGGLHNYSEWVTQYVVKKKILFKMLICLMSEFVFVLNAGMKVCLYLYLHCLSFMTPEGTPRPFSKWLNSKRLGLHHVIIE